MNDIAIEQTILQLVQAADSRDAATLSTLLAPDFRVVLHQFPHQEVTTILTRNGYLQMLEEGKIGGEARTVKVEGVFVSETIASVKATLESETNIFHSHYQLIQLQSKWMVVSDMPKMIRKSTT